MPPGIQASCEKATNLSELVAQRLKRLPTMRETWVRSLGRADPLEKEMATHSSILAWRYPMDREAWWATVHGVAKSGARLSNFTSLKELTLQNKTSKSVGENYYPFISSKK